MLQVLVRVLVLVLVGHVLVCGGYNTTRMEVPVAGGTSTYTSHFSGTSCLDSNSFVRGSVGVGRSMGSGGVGGEGEGGRVGDLVWCEGEKRVTMREYALLHVSTASSRQEYQRASLPSSTPLLSWKDDYVSASSTSTTVVIEVTSVVDSTPNATLCQSSLSSTDNCNYRSAIKLCQQILTSPLSYCTINLPPFGVLVLDPLLGDITLDEVAGNFIMVGNGCTLKMQVRAFDTTSMRPLVLVSSTTEEISLTMRNLTVSGFKQLVLQDAVHIGGAFSFTNLALGVIEFLNCKDNQEYSGGCMVFVGGQRIYIEDSEFVDNFAHEQGGALVFSDHTTSSHIKRCHFKGNRAKVGGGLLIIVANEGLNVEDCIFETNSALLAGGAVSVLSNNVNLKFKGCVFSSNLATFDGGAMHFYSNNVDTDVTTSRFLSNRAPQGGAMHLAERNRNFDVSSSYFFDNTANYGGGIYVYSNNHDFLIKNTEFEGNVANLNGGATYVYSDNNEADYINLIMTNNKAIQNGGAMYFDFSNDIGRIQLSTFDGNEATGNGGAVFLGCKNTNFVISESIFRNNIGRKYGGAIAFLSSNTLFFVSKSLFEYNTAGESGGAVHSSLGNSGFIVTRSEFYENYAPNYGGAVFIGNDHDNMTISNVVIRHCHAIEGGAVYVGQFNSMIKIDNTTIEENEAFNNGGGLLSYALSIHIRTSRFLNNIAGNAGGGVFLVRGASGVIIANSLFESNTANMYAGLGIDSQHSVAIRDCVFNDNHATVSAGGGLTVKNSNDISIVNCTIKQNTANTMGGGLMLANFADVSINGTAVKFNIAKTLGGGIFVDDGSNILISCGDLSHNIAFINGGGAFIKEVKGIMFEQMEVTANVARNDSGGALYVEATEMSLENNRFRFNLATAGGGGAFFWVKNGMDEPRWLRSIRNLYYGNLAAYGYNWATDSSQLFVDMNVSDLYVDDYSTGPQVVATLHDYYNQFVPLNTSEHVVALLHVNPASTSCGLIAGYLTGGVVTSFQRGIANFSDFDAYCVPGGTFEITVSHVSTSDGVDSRFASDFYVQFRDCGRGEYYSDRVCVDCDLGSYSFMTSSNVEELKPSICKSCPENAKWCKGDRIHLEDGYWRNHENSEDILKCPWGDRGCIGSTSVGQDLCAAGYEGPLCAVCSDGYHFTRSTQSCEPCENRSSWLDAYSSLVAIILLCVGAGVGGYIFKTRVMNREKLYSLDDVLVYLAMCIRLIDATTYYRNKEKMSVYTKEHRRRFNTRVRIYIAFFQIISVVPFVLDLDFPSVYTMVTAFLGAIVNFNASTSTVVTCSVKSGYDFIDILYVDIVTPIVVTILLKIVSKIHLHVKTKKWIRKQDPDLINKQNRILSYYFLTFLLYTYMFLPSLSAVIFQTFSCTNIDEDDVAEGDDWFLRADYSVSCETTRYSIAVIVASIAVVLYPIGVPAFYLYHLYSNRHSIKTRNEVCRTAAEEKIRLLHLRPLRILFDVYKPKYWYWEVIETFYRLCLTGVLVLINQGSSLQIIMGVLFSLFFIRLYELACPYEDNTLQQIKDISLWQIFFIFGCALMINGEYIDSKNGLLVVFMMFVIFCNLFADMCRWVYVVTRDDNTRAKIVEIKRKSMSLMTSSLSQEVVSPLACVDDISGGVSECGSRGSVELTTTPGTKSSDDIRRESKI